MSYMKQLAMDIEDYPCSPEDKARARNEIGLHIQNKIGFNQMSQIAKEIIWRWEDEQMREMTIESSHCGEKYEYTEEPEELD